MDACQQQVIAADLTAEEEEYASCEASYFSYAIGDDFGSFTPEEIEALLVEACGERPG